MMPIWSALLGRIVSGSFRHMKTGLGIHNMFKQTTRHCSLGIIMLAATIGGRALDADLALAQPTALAQPAIAARPQPPGRPKGHSSNRVRQSAPTCVSPP